MSGGVEKAERAKWLAYQERNVAKQPHSSRKHKK